MDRSRSTSRRNRPVRTKRAIGYPHPKDHSGPFFGRTARARAFSMEPGNCRLSSRPNNQLLWPQLFQLSTLPVFRRFSRGVKYAQNFDAFQAWSDTIRYEVPGTRDDELTSAEDAAGTSQRRILRQHTDGFMDLLNDFTGHCRVIPRDILGFLIKVDQGFPQPLNLHSRPICPAFFSVLSRWQNPRHLLRPGPF